MSRGVGFALKKTAGLPDSADQQGVPQTTIPWLSK